MILIPDSRVLWTIALWALLTATSPAQTLPDRTTPSVGTIEMPLVTPEEAAKYLAARKVPSSDPIPLPKMANGRVLVKINVDPVLGHELPTDDTTPSGFKRADFATAKASDIEKMKKQREDTLGSVTTLGSPPQPKPVIQRRPPQLNNR